MGQFIESFSAILTPYKSIIGPVASVLTIGQFFAGALICKDIAVQGNTEGFSSMPFIGGLVIGALMLKYSMMLNDSSMFVVNLAAVLLNIIYTYFFNKYSRSKKQDIHQPLMWGTILMTVIFAYTFWEQEEVIEHRYGLIVTVLMLALLGSPLIEVKEIVRKKDASSIPLPITFMACIVTSLWFLYGIILKNEFMIIQNFIGFLLCLTQLALYCVYRCPDTKKQKKL